MIKQKANIPIPVILLAALTALAPLAIDAYLPALPAIADYYAVSIHDVELSLSVFLAGFSFGQLIGGPFSDHFGRRLSMFSGLGIFLLGSLMVITSPGIEWMWLGRAVQALGGGLAIVNPAAIIRDLSSGVASARSMAHMSVIMMLAPMLAPVIGSVFLRFSSWQAIFVFLFLYCCIVGLIILRQLPETRILQAHRPSALNRYWQVISHRQALGFGFSVTFNYAALFAFVTASPLVYINYFGASEQLYPLLFGANVAGMITFNRLNVLLLRRFQPVAILITGQYLQLVTLLSLVVYLWLCQQPQLWVAVGHVALFACFQSLIAPNATACAIEYFPHNSATASALIGAKGFFSGALSGAAVGFFGDGTALPMAMTMLICALMGLFLRVLLHRSATEAQNHPEV